MLATLLDLDMLATRATLSEVATLAAFNRWYQKTILSQTLDIVSLFILSKLTIQFNFPLCKKPNINQDVDQPIRTPLH